MEGWNKNFEGAKRKKKKHSLEKLQQLELIKEIRDLNDEECLQWQQCQLNLNQLYDEEEKYWKNRSKQKWLEEGDSNTQYFHKSATNRSKKLSILHMEIQGQMTDQLPLIENHIVDYYQTLLGVPGIKGGSLHSDFWADNEKITSLDNKLLIAPSFEEEIKHAVFSSDSSGAPGPDGISFGFYQHFWDIVKSDICRLVQAFVDNKIDLRYLNQVVVCLLPKEKEVTSIKQYRPISLVNCSMKIISKLLTVRLENVMDRLIDQTQAAFIRGRYILDNVVLSHELLHYCKQNKEEGVVIKIDFEKAYDKVNWQFLKEMLITRGFDLKWVSWILQLLYSSTTCININGKLSSYFPCQRGV